MKTFKKLLEVIAVAGFTTLEDGQLMCSVSGDCIERLTEITANYVAELSFLGMLSGEPNAV